MKGCHTMYYSVRGRNSWLIELSNVFGETHLRLGSMQLKDSIIRDGDVVQGIMCT